MRHCIEDWTNTWFEDCLNTKFSEFGRFNENPWESFGFCWFLYVFVVPYQVISRRPRTLIHLRPCRAPLLRRRQVIHRNHVQNHFHFIYVAWFCYEFLNMFESFCISMGWPHCSISPRDSMSPRHVAESIPVGCDEKIQSYFEEHGFVVARQTADFVF